MPTRRTFLHATALAAVIRAAPARAAPAAPLAIVGILEGSATLIRQTRRHAVVEGLALQPQDIIETAEGGFVQLELADGLLLGLGERSRLMLAPPAKLPRTADPGRAPLLYLMAGWLKFSRIGPAPAAQGACLAPRLALDCREATGVLQVGAETSAVFVESGALRLLDRGAAGAADRGDRGDRGDRRAVAALDLGANEFVVLRPGATPERAARPSGAFLAGMPRPFRDPLPARAARFAGREIVSKPLAEVGYDEVAAWLQAEPALRVPLLPRWRSRAGDRGFRAAVQAHLAAHPEWEPVVYPERFIKKLQPVGPASAPAAEPVSAR